MTNDTERTLASLMAMEQTFETEGWKEIIKNLYDEIEVIKGQLLAAKRWEDVTFLQGRSEQCFRTIYLPDAIANMRVQTLLEVQDADV